jgi:predicted lipid-binding transport protein (Tim44 family)
MPWTGEDTKDVFKKILGGLIAAAILAMVYAVIGRVEWYYSAALGAFLVATVLLLVSLYARRSQVAEGPSAGVRGASTLSATNVHGEEISESQPASCVSLDKPGYPRPSSPDDSKAMKKTVKAEQKRQKKEAKTRKKT